MKIAILPVMALSLAACVDTVSEQEGTFVYEGQSYRAVTREFARSDGSTYKRRSIAYGVRFVTCSATDDLDCNAAIRNARSDFDR